MNRGVRIVVPGVFASLLALTAIPAAGASPANSALGQINHIVVIYQENGGLPNRYVTGSDAIGLTMGVYKTQALPIYQYLHASGHPQYAIADKFFQGAFGGSFLNHQWLVAAASPIFAGAANDGSAI